MARRDACDCDSPVLDALDGLIAGVDAQLLASCGSSRPLRTGAIGIDTLAIDLDTLTIDLDTLRIAPVALLAMPRPVDDFATDSAGGATSAGISRAGHGASLQISAVRHR